MTAVSVNQVPPTPVGVARAGPPGKGWTFGEGAPADNVGRVGEMYLDVDPEGLFDVYGPKLGATWAGAQVYPLGAQAAEAVAAKDIVLEKALEVSEDAQAAALSAQAAQEAAELAATFDPTTFYTKTASDSRYATAAQGGKADTAIQPAGLTKAAVGLGSVDNTNDASKPVSTPQQTALNLKLNTSAKAAGGDVRTGTDDAKYLTSKAIRDAMAFAGLTDASTIAIDMATGFNFSVTLGGNRTLGAPTNSIAGQSGLILIIQDGTGSRTLSYNSAWKFAGGTPTASTVAGTVDAIAYTVTTGGGSPIIRATYIKAFA